MIKVSAVSRSTARHRGAGADLRQPGALLAAFKAGELERDFVAVVRFQGPRANGMPELHKLTPPLAVLQDQGFKVALVTDGRMSRRLGQGAGGDPRHARRPAPAARSARCATAT